MLRLSSSAFLLLSCALVPIAKADDAAAHHSIAMFDRNAETTISGTVSRWEWTNPHCWLDVLVEHADGTGQHWMIKANSTGQMGQGGWSADSLHAGEKVLVTINPIRDGTRGGRLVSVQFSDGRILHRASDVSGTRPYPF
jgi:hypothetical protein